MARPRTPASQKQGKSETQAHLNERAEVEENLAGNRDKIFDIPEQLDELGKIYYEFLIEELSSADFLSNLDIPLLTQTADALSKIEQCDQIINDEGMLWRGEDRSGNEVIKEHPTVNTKHKYLNQFRALSTQLGLSPSSRASLAEMKVQDAKTAADPVASLLAELASTSEK